MVRTIILILAMLSTPYHQQQNAAAYTLEPDLTTLQIFGDGPRVVEPCGAWPVKPFQPRPFNLRGKIFDASANEVGSYFARGTIRQSDGAHVADYALTIKGVGTIVFAVDALPDVDAAEIDGFVFSGAKRNAPFFITFRPRQSTDCVWGMRWDAVLQVE